MTTHIEVKGYQVDRGTICRLAHRCNPSMCSFTQCCCSAFDAWIGAEENERLSKYFISARNYLKSAEENGDFADCLRWVGAGFVLKKGAEGLCSLSYRAEDGSILCSLHSVALHMQISPAETKPDGCMLWPLSLTGTGRKTLSVQDGVYSFPCNTLRRGKLSSLDPGTAELIRANFGEAFLSELSVKRSPGRAG